VGFDSRVTEEGGRSYTLGRGSAKVVKNGQYLLGAAGAASNGVTGPVTGDAVTRIKHRHHIFQLVLGTGGTPVVALDFSIDGINWTQFSLLSTAAGLFKMYSDTPFPYLRARRTDTDADVANKVKLLLRSAGDSADLN
jgi:hypothetical protein